MKKDYLLCLAVASIAVLGITSCDKDKDNGSGANTVDSKVVGKWIGIEDYHYPIVSFNNDGTYEWMWDGLRKLKDTGKYTYAANEIKMTPSEYYDMNDDGELVKVQSPESENFTGTRKCKVIEVNDGILSIEVYGDYFMGGENDYGFPFVLYRDGIDQELSQADLKGTWEEYDEKGNVSMRYVFDEAQYTLYNVWGWDDQLAGSKTVGNWAFSKGRISFNPVDCWYSYETGVDAQNKTVYTYSTVNPQTLEAEKWTKTRYTPRNSTDKVYLSNGKLYLGGITLVKK